MLSLFLLPIVNCRAEASVTMNIVDSEVREVLTSLASIGGVNIVADDSVNGKITVQLAGVSFQEALDIITKTKGLQYQTIGNTIIVGTKNNMSAGFGQLHVFHLKFANPDDVVNAAKLALGLGGSTESSSTENSTQTTTTSNTNNTNSTTSNNDGTTTAEISGNLTVDKATNSLLFYGTASEAQKIRVVLDQIDIPYEQVSLEAQVMSINKTDSKNLGIEWEWSKAPQSYEEYTPEKITIDATTGRITSIEPAEITRASSFNKGTTGGIISFGRSPDGLPYEFYYAAKINALINNGKANILSKPKITTINGKEATINIGGEVPIPTLTVSDNTTTTTYEYKETGIILKYTPRVNDDGYITAKIHTEVSTPTYDADAKAYRFNKRSADTQVRLKDGETMVIGGLIGSDESKVMSKIPFLGDLPILGRFFSNVNNSKNESEVIIFVTARIVK
ncbi:MAG: secretin and TonB N-terminal domain-containing protein [Negativicutes bacterium]|nr:secretin and TonB N-terminal domain-containing protein [Negativicutes bacterium]